MLAEDKDFLINRISKYRELERHYESNVTAIVNLLLDLCDIRGKYGYIIFDESVMISIKRILPPEAKYKKSDKTGFKYQESRPVRGNLQVDDEKPLLQNDDQLTTYMSSIKFPYGMLISEYKACLYKGSYSSGSVRIKRDGKVRDTVKDIDDLEEFVKQACL
ncbi:hypothetical protein CONCODRAFT_10031 [Conidiobolus coronatus NRRL 28638]|uniref:Uncharacterized protein n=1 Tax=Conidiobolus coronatus (strain ATCC 28846 / CBS 209.66 / NRRL 28638) TaxID=796925 RepID=A0A137NYL8_CONC2|nr:hypothetical protein CONCODRAFT_10031 [Conidiobolus coronatus NRRL 28638]|eukprot:KXN67847.1 hypothetical protein CONCODRAFT_10031 [Conidiobolus coronatus NRRL 28638]